MSRPNTYISEEQENSGIIPYRIRLSDAGKINIKDYGFIPRKSAVVPNNSEIPDEKWNNFLEEFFNIEDKQYANVCRRCSKNIKSSKKQASQQLIWIDALKMFISPPKALVFEKYWGKLLLGEKTFSMDPAPYIATCRHCKLTLSQEEKKEMHKRVNLQTNNQLNRIRKVIRDQDAKEISEASKRLAEFKKALRENVEKQRRKEMEYQAYRRRIAEGRLNSMKNESFRRESQFPTHQRSSNIQKRPEDATKFALPLIKERQKRSPSYRQSHHVALVLENPSERSYSDDDCSIDETIETKEGAEESLVEKGESSPDLLPVEMPDWVREFLERKKKAKEEIEAATEEEKELPIPVLVACEEENGITVEQAEIISSENTIARQLDSTADLMSKVRPYPFGMESREIPDQKITASSQQDPFHRPNQARLNNEHNGKNAGAWCPKKHDNRQWLQIDLGKIRNVQQICTQGMPLSSVRRPKDKRWVDSFAISYSDKDEGWKYYQDKDGNPKVFIGNTDLVNISTNSFTEGLMCRFIRMHPVSWNQGIALRVEIYGERDEKRNENEEKNLLIPSEATAMQRYASETDDVISDQSSENDEDSASEYVFKDDDYDTTDDESRMHDPGKLNPGLELSASNEMSVSEASLHDTSNSSAALDLEEEHSSMLEEIDDPSNMTDSVDMESRLKEDEEARRILEAHKKQLKEEAEKKFIEEMMRQEMAEKRRLKFRNVVQKLTRKQSRSHGLTLDQDENDFKDDFLSMYCILKESQKILYSRAFQQLDKNGDGTISYADAMTALKMLNLNILKESEMKYILKIIDTLEPQNQLSIDQKTFNVIAGFSDRLKNVDIVTRGFIRMTNFETLFLHAHKTRDLFEKLLERNERTISSEQFLIELEAGGVSEENRQLAILNLKGRSFLDFLDFLVYFPLILYTHDSILSTPL